MSCANVDCLVGRPHENADGSCGCTVYETGGVKPIPVQQGWIRPPLNWNPGTTKPTGPPLLMQGECNIEAPSGFIYVWVKGRCVLHPLNTPLPTNAVVPDKTTRAGSVINATSATDTADKLSTFVQENKLLVFGGVAAVLYFMFGAKDKPKSRVVTSESRY